METKKEIMTMENLLKALKENYDDLYADYLREGLTDELKVEMRYIIGEGYYFMREIDSLEYDIGAIYEQEKLSKVGA
jgi:hypothetical protein